MTRRFPPTRPLVTGRRLRALLTGAATVLLVSACGVGVPPSDVIQAGDPATGMAPGISVYFLAGGNPVAVPRRAPDDSGLAVALRLLFEGPTPEESDLTTELPRLTTPPKLEAKGSSLLISLPDGVGPLSRPAMEQVVCTVTAVRSTAQAGKTKHMPPDVPSRPGGPTPYATSGEPVVIVAGSQWVRTEPESCPAP